MSTRKSLPFDYSRKRLYERKIHLKIRLENALHINVEMDPQDMLLRSMKVILTT